MKISLTNYVRIHSIITAILNNEDARIDKACLYYASFGAFILSEKLGIDARMVTGVAAYHLGDNGNILTFGERDGDLVKASKTGFHAWVVADGWLIDFMAPIFGTAEFMPDKNTSFEAKMLQKPISDMKDDISSISTQGDFFLLPDGPLTMEHYSFMHSKPMIGDLAEICCKWFVKAPGNIPPSIGIGNKQGDVNFISYEPVKLNGVW